MRSVLSARLHPDSSGWSPWTSPTDRWRTAVGSRSSEWSSTATRSLSTGGSPRYRPEALLAAELAEPEPDLEGLSDDFEKILRDKLTQRLQMQRRSLTLIDDVGNLVDGRRLGWRRQ